MSAKQDKKPADEPFPGDQTTAGNQQSAGTDVAIYDPGQDAGAGLEDISKDEYSVPFVKILDAKSPQCKPAAQGGLPGAKGGAIINMATNEIFDGEKGVEFIPVHRDHHFVEWIPKNEDGTGGGFVGIRQPEDPLVIQLRAEQGAFGKLKTSDNHELAETYYLYGLLVQDDQGTPVVIGFASTQIKKYRNFISRVMNIKYQGAQGMVTPPMWAHFWRFTTVYESKGANSWYGWRLNLKSEPPLTARLKMNEGLYIQAREFYNSIKAGKVVVKQPEREPGDDQDDNIPM